MYDKIFDSDVYEQSFKDINEAYKEYQETFASGNEEAIETAKQSFAEIVQGATEGINDQSVIDYFNSMYPDLQEVVGDWEFEVRFNAAIDDDANDFENEVKNAIGNFDSSNEVLNFRSSTATQEQIDAYTELNNIADEYNLTLEQLITKLEQLGLISYNVKIDLRNKLSNGTQNLIIDDWIDTLTDEEAKIANSTAFDEALDRQKESLNGVALSADNYSAALEEVKAQQDELSTGKSVSLTISDTVNQLNTQLKPAMDSLKSAWNDIFTDDGFALNSIDILSTCDSIKSKLDEMSELGLNVDYSSYEDFVRVLNNSESEAWQVEDAFDSLATSITQAALSGAEDFETMKAALEDLGVVNNEIVAFDALASNAEMLDEALAQANVSMDDFIVNAKEGTVEATKAGQAFLEEKVGAENCAEALSILAFHKEVCNLQEMNTAGEVANLRTLAENAGYTGEVIQYLTELEQIYQEVASGTLNFAQISAKVARAAALKAWIDNAASNINYEPKVDFSGATKAAGKAGKDAGKSYKDALKEELSDIEGVISGITGKIDDQISSINEQKSTALDAIDAEKEALEEAKDAAVEALEAEREARLEVIDAEKEQLEAQIKLIDKQIDAKQDEIDAKLATTTSSGGLLLALKRAVCVRA